MRSPLILAIFAFTALPAMAADAPANSWGKAGISFDDYRRDSVECGREAYYLDIAETEQAAILKRASTQLEMHDGSFAAGDDPVTDAVRHGAQSEQIRAAARADKQIRELRRMMDDRLAQCLVTRGYTRITLTREQRDALEELKKGTPQRHQYLFALASDPVVLARQASPLAQ